jgi:hypothetical protein
MFCFPKWDEKPTTRKPDGGSTGTRWRGLAFPPQYPIKKRYNETGLSRSDRVWEYAALLLDLRACDTVVRRSTDRRANVHVPRGQSRADFAATLMACIPNVTHFQETGGIRASHRLELRQLPLLR